MSKKRFVLPYVALTVNDGGDVTIIGGGTGQGGSDAIPISYQAWLESTWAEDLVGEGNGIDENDYAVWWESNGFTQEDWEDLNPDLPWDEYF